MHHECQECTRLWSEYALATRHHLKLEGRLRMADLSHDQAAIEELTPLVKTALDQRVELRRLIERHERQAQAGSAGA
jgi:hypothetical protein